MSQVLAKRRAMEARRARQEARAAHAAATRGAPMPDVVVLANFFDDDGPLTAAVAAPVVTVAAAAPITRIAVPVGGGAVRVRTAAMRRTLAMSV